MAKSIRQNIVFHLVCSAAAVTTALVGTAHAQTEAQTSDTTEVPAGAPGEIVVTAQRRSESLQKVPMSVNVATGAQLEKLNLLDIKDVQRLAPGLQLTNNDGRSNIATLRGISYSPDSNTLPAVEIYVNEIPIDAATAFTASYDIAQIEVLRGPQGIFRGRTAPAGAITITTRKPDLDDFEGYMQGTVTTRDAMNVQGAANIPLIPGKLALRAAGLVDFNRAAQVKNVDGDRSRGDTQSARLSLAYQPTPDVNAVLTYQYLHSDVSPYIAVFGPGNQPSAFDPARSGPPLDLSDRRSVTELTPRFINQTHFVTLAADWKLGDGLAWSLNAGYQGTNLSQRSDTDTANAVPGYAGRQDVFTGYRIFTMDTRLASDNSGFFNWMVGGFYSHSKYPGVVRQDSTSFSGFADTPLPAALGGFPLETTVSVPILTKNYSAFGSVRLKFSERLRFQAGLRYSKIVSEQSGSLTVFSPTTNEYFLNNYETISPENRRKTYKPLTGGASLSFDVLPELTTYISYGHSYRPGAVAVGITTVLSDDLLVSRPETSDSVEAGFRANLFDHHLTFNVSAFYQKFKGYIDFANGLVTSSARDGIPDQSAASFSTNGNVISKGVEAEIAARISRNADLGIGLSYVNAKYDNALIPCNDFNGDGIPDSMGTPSVPVGQQVALCNRNDRIAQQPRFNLTANGEVRLPIGEYTPFARGLLSYRPCFTSTYDDYRYRDFTNISLFIGVKGPDSKWELSLFAKNLLDQTRATSVSQGIAQISTAGLDLDGNPTGASGAPFNSGYRTAVITSPREFGLTARFNW